MSLESVFHTIANATPPNPSVIICDRGLMDGKAYMSPESWSDQLRTLGTNEVSIRDSRYDAVFHLVTAADGAEASYTCANNEARMETVKEARDLDLRTQRAWLGHPHHFVFDNSGDFESKLRSLVDAVCGTLGLPRQEKSSCTKFLLDPGETSKWEEMLKSRGVVCQTFSIEKVYLMSGVGASSSPASGSYSFVRRRSLNNVPSYGRTTVTPSSKKGHRPVELKRIITPREYASLIESFADPTRHVVVQERVSFIWRGKTCQIHCYVRPRPGLAILHVQGVGGVEGLEDVLGRWRELVGEEDEAEYGAKAVSLK